MSKNIQLVKLGQLLNITTGKLDVNASSENGTYPFFTCARKIYKINTYAFDNEAVLVAGNGDLNVKYYNGKFNAYQRTYVLTAKNDEIDIKYLYFFMQTYIQRLRDISIGGVIKYIKLGNLTDAKIPFLPLQDQQKTAGLLSQIEKLIRKREDSINLLDELTKSIFLEMFLHNIDRHRWEHLKLENVLNSIGGGWSPKCQDVPRKDNENGILKLSALSGNTYNDKENKAMFNDIKPKINTVVQHNDLLFSRKNTYELVGSCAYVFETEENLFLPDLIFQLNTNEQINKIYLWKLLTSLEWKLKLKKIANGAAGSMPNISKSKLLKMECLLPPINLQDKFAVIITQIEQTKTIYHNSLIELNNLFGSIAQKAFKGELDVSKIELIQSEILEHKLSNENQIEQKEIIYSDENNQPTFSKNFLKMLINQAGEITNEKLLEVIKKFSFKEKISFDEVKIYLVELLEAKEVKQIVITTENTSGFEKEIGFKVII